MALFWVILKPCRASLAAPACTSFSNSTNAMSWRPGTRRTSLNPGNLQMRASVQQPSHHNGPPPKERGDMCTHAGKVSIHINRLLIYIYISMALGVDRLTPTLNAHIQGTNHNRTIEAKLSSQLYPSKNKPEACVTKLDFGVARTVRLKAVWAKLKGTKKVHLNWDIVNWTSHPANPVFPNPVLRDPQSVSLLFPPRSRPDSQHHLLPLSSTKMWTV